ncbi:hypothetical protein EW145_g3950 [Phellinidium pouzarii]|uniref:Cytochrome P450 n=1 Tax=Phellinidium pouzarii TaxID=167371 RepID=A0A4S4L751_9AGAM|nr:hypothetical protein EW145_g3950 [Phellinidium pouzarii]
MGKPYIFINTYDAAVELLDKRGYNYSSKPHNTLIALGGWTKIGSLLPYSDEHRKMRQYLHRFFGKSAVEDFHELQTQVTHRLLLGLLRRPDRLDDLIRHSTGETIMMVAYGYEVSEENDEYIKLADEGIKGFAEAEGFSFVNMVPWLRFIPEWVPGTGFHKRIRDGLQLTHEMVYKPYEMTKKKIFDGTAIPSMTSKLIETNATEDGNINDEFIIATSTSIAYLGGADTVATSDSFCVKEDDVYDGQFIPAGTTMLANIWAMQRDPVEYPEPEKFIPERWIQSEGKKLPRDVRRTVFGFGRRICSGRHFAENSIYVIIASILATFDIEKALDENGVPITPPLRYTPSFIRHSEPFKCKITPRSNKTASLIQQAVEFSK